MEDQLSALGERWSHVCQWAEQRASRLKQLVNHWEQLDGELKRLKSWLAAHEQSLRLIEANPSTDRNQMLDVARQLQVNCLSFIDFRLLATLICPIYAVVLITNRLLLFKLLERDMEPHIERMHVQQEQIQLLPSLIEAVMVKEQSTEALPVTTYQCVDRLLADMEHLEDRIEALNEIMDAQRQRVSGPFLLLFISLFFFNTSVG